MPKAMSFTLDDFASYVEEVKQNNPGNLRCCFRRVNALSMRAINLTQCMDSILPCPDWLVTAQCTKEQVRRFNTQLNRLMAKLNPIQIFLTGDTEAFLKRAMKDRGENWARRLAQERCNSDDIRDLITYFNEMGEVASELLTEWSFKQIVLDTTKHNLPTCAEEILRHLDLDGNPHAEHL